MKYAVIFIVVVGLSGCLSYTERSNVLATNYKLDYTSNVRAIYTSCRYTLKTERERTKLLEYQPKDHPHDVCIKITNTILCKQGLSRCVDEFNLEFFYGVKDIQL